MLIYRSCPNHPITKGLDVPPVWLALNLKELDGWNDITSNMFVNNFKKFIDFYNKIKKYITIIEPKKKTKKGKYKDMKIVLSGFRDKEIKEYLENEGATITNTISKNTKPKDIWVTPRRRIFKPLKKPVLIIAYPQCQTVGIFLSNWS